jgi:hypothetical protein
LPTKERKETMVENERHTIDPNADDVDTLSGLPGIGRKMAQRIIDARPFERSEDLIRVQGIGPSTLARLQPLLALGGSDGGGRPDEIGEGAESVEAKAPETPERIEVPPSPEMAAHGTVETEGAESEESELEAPPTALEKVLELETPLEPSVEPPEEPEVTERPLGPETAIGEEAEEAEPAEGMWAEPSALAEVEKAEEAEEAEVEQLPEGKEPQPARRRWVMWTVAGSALLVLILSLALNLGILSSINGGRLQFASPAELGQVRVRVDGLDARADELGQEVQGLRARLDNVEAFGGRIDALEGSSQQLRADLEDTASQVQDLSGEVSDLGQELNGLSQDLAALDEEIIGLQGEVQTLQEQTARTQSFFDGLRGLLNELFAPEGGAE